MSQNSAVLSLPYIQPAQAQKHVTHNEALRQLDMLVQLAVADRDRGAPPAQPATGDRHIVAAPSSGAWAGHEGAIALFTGDDGWHFAQPLPGWRAWVGAEARLVVWDGSAWVAATAPEQLPLLGLNATADTTNRLSVAAAATLLSHDGAGHQLKLNKSAETDTASLLFQTGWSGRAEMGTAGSDAFAIKVSADGSAWLTALAVDPVSGQVTGQAVQQDVFDATPGRLMTVGGFGMGGQMPSCPDDDLDQAPAGSICKFDVGDVNKPGPANAAGMVQTLQWSGTTWLQKAHLFFPGSHTNRVYHRVKQGTEWQPWQETVSQASLLGPVAQSGGVPTGAVIERGATADGAYVRFADGTQICTHDAPAQASDVASGALFSAGSDAGWTFPQPFAAPPVVSGQMAGGAGWVAVGDSSAADAQYRRWSAVSEAAPAPLRLMAVGRWI